MSAPAFSAVRAAISRAGGWLAFDGYMETALHSPAGFYGGGRVQFGAGGDFITAPLLSPLFAKMLARQTAQILSQTGGAVLELGAGDGTLAAQMLAELRAQNAKTQYYILETAAPLKARQQQKLSNEKNIEWLDKLPGDFCGAVIANEVLDAVPFLLFAKRGGEWRARGVAEQNGALRWLEKSAPENEFVRRLAALDLPDGFETEISPRAEALTASVCEMLREGAFFAADYGFGRREFYHPQRAGGTMMCHRAGLADSEPLESPGDKDITAHIDWTAMADAAISGGAKIAGYTTLAHFLLNCGAAEVLENLAKTLTAAEYAKFASGAQKLLAPHEMGELFKVAAFTKGDMPPLLGFSAGCQKRRL